MILLKHLNEVNLYRIMSRMNLQSIGYYNGKYHNCYYDINHNVIKKRVFKNIYSVINSRYYL